MTKQSIVSSEAELKKLTAHFEVSELEERLEYGWGGGCVETSCVEVTNGCYTETIRTYDCE